MHLRTHTVGTVAVLRLSGQFDSAAAPAITEQIDRAVEASSAQVIVNLAEVTFIDSTALAALVRGLRQSRARGGDLYICGLSRQVALIFDLTRLDRAFTMFGTEAEALEMFTNHPTATRAM